MDNIISILLYLHIGAGMLSLVVAPVAMVVRKGGRQHRLWGKIFFGGMTAVITTAVVISIYKFIPFLLMIAVFSYYSIISGYRSMYLKKLHQGQKPASIDWIAAIAMAVFNAGFAGWGLYHAVAGNYSYVAYIAIGFGLLGFTGVFQNIRWFLKPPADKHHWLYEHMGGMLGGYIATVTAFSVTTFEFLPGVLRWTWPLVIGMPLINYWVRRYRRKLNTGSTTEELSIEINNS